MKIYKRKVYWSLYFFLIAIIVIIVLIKVLLPPNFFIIDSPIAFLPLAFPFIVVLFIQFYRSRSKIVITETKIINYNLFKKEELYFRDVLGFKTIKSRGKYSGLLHLLIVPKNTHLKSIKIHPSLVGFSELHAWIESEFTDYDDVDIAKERQNALENVNFGINPIQRELKIKRAKKTAMLLNILGGILFVLHFFPSIQNVYLLIITMLVPLLTIVSIYSFSGLIRLGKITNYRQDAETVYSSVFLAMVLPSINVLVYAIKHFHILGLSHTWQPTLIFSFFILFIIVLKTKEFSLVKIKDYLDLLFYIVLFSCLGFGSTISLNCLLDQSTPTVFVEEVLDLRMEKGSGRQGSIPTYYNKVTIINWKDKNRIIEKRINVSKELYNSLKIGNRIIISQRMGFLSIPWFEVEKE